MRVARRVLDAVVAHARASAPDECCGLLFGHDGEVVESRPTRNAADAPATRFLVDPKDHIDGRREARARGLDVVGFYHSHPRSGPEPSATDLAEGTWTDQVHLIVGLGAAAPSAKMFTYRDGSSHEHPFDLF